MKVSFVCWYPEIPAPPVVALVDLVVEGQLIGRARLVEDVELAFWGETFTYGGREYFVAKPCALKPAPWNLAASRAILPHLEEL
ncbi:MAG: hypothetical protein AB7S38_11180 [Vulcanimicrobiota bacterium]